MPVAAKLAAAPEKAPAPAAVPEAPADAGVPTPKSYTFTKNVGRYVAEPAEPEELLELDRPRVTRR
jgi:hypothetical protein